MRKTFRLGITALALIALAIGGVAWLGTGVAAQQRNPRAPRFQLDPAFPKIPYNWVFGSVSSVAVDSRDHIFIVQRPREVPEQFSTRRAPPIIEFDSSGNFITAWGGPARPDANGVLPYEWNANEHGIHVDYQGNIWTAGNNAKDGQFLKFSKNGTFLLQIGHAGQSKGNLDTANVHGAADTFVNPRTNEVFVADGYQNRRVAVYDADNGTFKRMWGAFGNAPSDPKPGEKDPPDTEEGYAGQGPQNFVRPVHGVNISKDNLVYVSDRGGKRVQVFTPEGKFVNQVFVDRDCHAPACGNGNTSIGVAFSPDNAQEFLFSGSRSGGRVWTIERKSLRTVESFGKFGQAPGEFDTLHGIATDSKGNIYTAEVSPDGKFSGRTQKFVKLPAGR